MSADVVAYSRLMAQDDVATVRLLLACQSEIEVAVLRHGGRIVDAPGDNLLAEFSSDPDAILCAIDVQRALTARNVNHPRDRRMRFRIGIHSGEVLVEQGKLYGDVVNVAARLEGLAEPGGVCISASTAGRAQARVQVPLEDLGEHKLKNIPYAVRVLKVSGLGEHDLSEPADAKRPVPGFGGRPALSVLPFADLDGRDEFLAHGLREELNVRLASFRGLPIVAYPPYAQPQACAPDVPQLGRELGVHYVVSVTLQHADHRLRVHARMFETTNGEQVWAQRYDHELRDIFDVQDMIAAEIIAAIEPELRRAESARVLRRAPTDLTAWECVQRGQWHLARMTREDNAQARELLARACALDPTYAAAFGSLALAQTFACIYGWLPARDTLREALRGAERAVELDDLDPFAHRSLGGVCGFLGQVARAIAENERAVQLNPSYALGYWGIGQWLPFVARAKEGIALLQTAIRLSPQDMLMDQFQSDLAFAYFGAELYEDALQEARLSIGRKATGNRAWPVLVASLGQLGQSGEAARASMQMLESSPGFTATGFAKVLGKIGADPRLVDAFATGLGRAGLH